MDFTLNSYKKYLKNLKEKFPLFLTFQEIIGKQSEYESYCLLRHDVDRKPLNALKMAKLENEMGLRATYYFRTKTNTLKPEIIKKIYEMGHEIGYHYENLSDCNGDTQEALIDFEKNLNKLREISPINTICMHGRPLKPYDNRDLWRSKEHHALLSQKFGILGEVYLDVDYSDIAYINDTGRNWSTASSNLRDKVSSKIAVDFKDAHELLNYLNASPHPRMVFQIHPERWADNVLEWGIQLTTDSLTNLAKTGFRTLNKLR